MTVDEKPYVVGTGTITAREISYNLLKDKVIEKKKC
jgi:hypothetical protein